MLSWSQGGSAADADAAVARVPFFCAGEAGGDGLYDPDSYLDDVDDSDDDDDDASGGRKQNRSQKRAFAAACARRLTLVQARETWGVDTRTPSRTTRETCGVGTRTPSRTLARARA